MAGRHQASGVRNPRWASVPSRSPGPRGRPPQAGAPPFGFESLEPRALLTAYWVDAAGGSDAFPGTADNPFRTITKAVNLARAGDSVQVRSGTYRGEKIAFQASGTTASPITLAAAPGADVQVKGSELVQGWQRAAGADPVYQHGGWNYYYGSWASAFTSTPQGSTSGLDARSKARNQLFVDGGYVREVPRPADLAAGTFYVDKTAHTISLWLPDGGDPAAHAVEAANTGGPLLAMFGRSYVNVRGLHFSHGANAPQDTGLVRLVEGNHLSFEDCSVEYAAGAGLDFSGTDHSAVLRSSFNHNGQEGIHSAAVSDSLVKDCDNSWNNTLAGKQFDRNWEAGGNKFSTSRRLVVDGMTAHDNWGNGIWFDIDNEGATITNCVSYRNFYGIHYEISYSATITNNLVYNNSLQGQATSYPAGIGIYINASAGCQVYNNTVWGNDTNGIGVNTVVRDDSTGRQVSAYSNRFFNNVVAQNEAAGGSARSYSIGYGNDVLKLPLPVLVNPNPDVPEDYNTSDYNLFWLAPAGRRFFVGPTGAEPTTLAGWQQVSGQDLHSVWADPVLLDPANGDLRPGAGSGVLGIGATLAAVPVDIAGRARYAGLFDAGAYQVTVPPPPAVVSVAVNDGAAQRSMVRGLTVTFSRPVVPDAGAFVLAGRDGAGAGTVVSFANPSADPLNPLAASAVWVLTFAGPAVVAGGLADGVYDLTVVASNVTAGDTGGVLAADFGFAFHRLFSDADGDGDSDNLDLLSLRSAYLKPNTDPAYAWSFDYDGNGTVDNLDVFQVRGRRGIAFQGY